MSLFCVLCICVFCIFFDPAFGCCTAINVCFFIPPSKHPPRSIPRSTRFYSDHSIGSHFVQATLSLYAQATFSASQLRVNHALSVTQSSSNHAPTALPRPCIRRHPQEVEEGCLIFNGQLRHEAIIVTIEKSLKPRTHPAGSWLSSTFPPHPHHGC